MDFNKVKSPPGLKTKIYLFCHFHFHLHCATLAIGLFMYFKISNSIIYVTVQYLLVINFPIFQFIYLFIYSTFYLRCRFLLQMPKFLTHLGDSFTYVVNVGSTLFIHVSLYLCSVYWLVQCFFFQVGKSCHFIHSILKDYLSGHLSMVCMKLSTFPTHLVT